jgi:arsenate reductase (thioredoxin)
MPDHYNVLFLCTGNSARSIMAEAILNHKGKGKFTAYSAGSHPTGQPRPEALKQIESAGLSAAGLRSKSWNEFSGPGAPKLDFVFTVCDKAAQEQYPYLPGQPMTAPQFLRCDVLRHADCCDQREMRETLIPSPTDS